MAGQGGSRVHGFGVSQSVCFNGIKFQIGSMKQKLSVDLLCTPGAGDQVPQFSDDRKEGFMGKTYGFHFP